MRSLFPILLSILSIISAGAVDAWPAQSTAQAAASSQQLLAGLDARMQWEMSGAHWNPLTRTLWVTAGGGSGVGTWALRHDAGSAAFRVEEFWSGPRDEDITQVSFTAVSANQHRVYILKEGPAQIVQALMTVNATGNGSSVVERTWSIPELTANGKAGAEGLTFVPDAWLRSNGFVDGAGAACTSQGGLGGLMLVAHQDLGRLFAIDLSADGSARFAGKTYRVVGIYRTGYRESSALCFDRSIGRLYISHNCDGNRIEVTDLRSTPITGDAKATRQMRQLAVFAAPTLSNPEGFACTPYLNANGSLNSERWAFFTSDCELDDTLTNRQRAVVWYQQFRPESDAVLSAAADGGQGQTAPAGTTLPTAPRVRVLDGRGYPAVGRSVIFSPALGMVSAVTATTDGQGRAHCGSWTLGGQSGAQSLRADIRDVGAVLFTATATAPSVLMVPPNAGAVAPWPGQSTDQAAAGAGQLLAALDPRLQREMSGAHWNPLTRTLWVTADTGSGAGTWALAYQAATGGFAVAGFWTGPRDEDITQVAYEPVGAQQHRICILKEDTGQIIQALMTMGSTPGSQVERTWTIAELAPSGSSGGEGMAFVPNAWLAANGFVDGAGLSCQATGGLGGLMLVVHQDGGRVYAIDLSADGSPIFAGKSYRVVGVYRTAYAEGSALCFDRSIGRLYILHNSGGHRLEVTDLRSTAISGDGKATRQLTPLAIMASPALGNPKGFACTPYLAADGSPNAERWAFFACDYGSGSPLAERERAVVWYRQFQPASGTGRTLAIAAGQGQTALAGTAVRTAPVVALCDGRGYPVVGATVAFAPGAGWVDLSTVRTDGQGRACCGAWILGGSGGGQILRASTADAPGVAFTATATVAIACEGRAGW